MIILIVSVLTALFGSFFCSLAEAVLLSLNPIRLEILQNQGKKHAQIWLEMKKNIDRPIAAILILNTIANTGGALMAGAVFEKTFGQNWLIVFSVFFTLLIVYAGEIFPKIIGVHYHENLSHWIIRPLLFFTKLFSPFFYLSKLIARLIGRRKISTLISTDDIQSLTAIAKSKNLIESKQEEIIVGALKLHQLKVEETMVPAEWIVYLKTSHPFAHNLEIVRNNLHTRYPISITEDINGVIGYVNYKEILAWQDTLATKEINEFIRPILIVRKDLPLTDMLKLFISKHHHLAIVKNNVGNIIGMVTLEDVIEEFLGDIEDEFDHGLASIVQIGPNKWRIGGDTGIGQFLNYFQISEEPGTAKTLSEWLIKKTKGILFPGTQINLENTRIIIQHARRGKVYQAQVEKM